MSFLGNILWFVLGGLFSGLSWVLSGIIWCITIVGIPYGKQCFKFASMSFAPFGKEIEYGGGVTSLLANVIGIIFSVEKSKVCAIFVANGIRYTLSGHIEIDTMINVINSMD